MAFEVKIPSVGESITSGTIAQWHKKDGEHVNRGDIIFTLETDKISTEIEADESGRLEIKSPEGEEVPIGSVVALIQEGEGAAPAAEPEAAPAEPSEPVPEASAPADGPTKLPVMGDKIERVAKAAERAAAMMSGKVATPPAKTAVTPAREGEPAAPERDEAAAKGGEEDASGAPLTLVPTPLKERGAIVEAKEDKPVLTPTEAEDTRVTRKKMTPLRRKIATQLVAAQRDAAILTTFNEVDMSQVMRFRKQMQEAFIEKYGIKLGFMSFFIKAVVFALKAVPQVNGRIDGNEIVTNHYYDIGVAVGTDRGLFVPVVRDCDQKSFAEIERSISDFASRASEGKIQLEDLQGGVFTISNGGIYGSMLSTPILNPPQSGILGMHTIQQRPVAVDGQVVIRPMMYLALSYDHRLVDGKEAVTFLKTIKEVLEEPGRLLVEV